MHISVAAYALVERLTDHEHPSGSTCDSRIEIARDARQFQVRTASTHLEPFTTFITRQSQKVAMVDI
jgi:hypothetical protein